MIYLTCIKCGNKRHISEWQKQSETVDLAVLKCPVCGTERRFPK